MKKLNEYEIQRFKEMYDNGEWECTFTEYLACQCSICENECIHKGAMRRYPVECGGLGLCKNLKD